MKKLMVVLLALALLALPMTGFAAGKSTMFGTGTAATETPEPITEPDPTAAPIAVGSGAPAGTGYSDNGFAEYEIRDAVTAFLDDIGWTYSVEDNGIVTFGMNIDSKLGSLNYRLRFFDNGFTSYAYPGLYADSASKEAIAEYLHRANYGLRNGNFEIDFSDGEIRYKSYVDCSNHLPGPEVIRRAISVPGDMFEIYGDGLLQVSFGLMTPEDAINAAEAD